VRDLPIISPHGHVDPRLLVDDAPFADPASLFVTPDHYVTRLLHASGVGLDAVGVGRGPLPEADARDVWRLLCSHWHVCRGTPVRYWLENELADIFGVALLPSAETADAIYDQVAEQLATDDYRPRALYRRFGIAVLATTDDPADDLAAHAALAAVPTWSGRIIPTFRPDRYLEPAQPGWPDAVARLGERSKRRYRRLRGVCAGTGGAPAVLRRARRRLGRPQPHRRPHRPAGAGRGGPHLPVRGGR
jgi:glucuronate isomerase